MERSWTKGYSVSGAENDISWMALTVASFQIFSQLMIFRAFILATTLLLSLSNSTEVLATEPVRAMTVRCLGKAEDPMRGKLRPGTIFALVLRNRVLVDGRMPLSLNDIVVYLKGKLGLRQLSEALGIDQEECLSLVSSSGKRITSVAVSWKLLELFVVHSKNVAILTDPEFSTLRDAVAQQFGSVITVQTFDELLSATDEKSLPLRRRVQVGADRQAYKSDFLKTLERVVLLLKHAGPETELDRRVQILHAVLGPALFSSFANLGQSVPRHFGWKKDIGSRNTAFSSARIFARRQGG